MINLFLEIFTYYFLIINILSVAICIFDKLSAKRQGKRISEKTLFLLCFLGGSVAMYLTMYVIRHKTRHKRFMIGIPLIILMQIIGVLIFIKNI